MTQPGKNPNEEAGSEPKSAPLEAGSLTTRRCTEDSLVGIVVRRPPQEWKVPGSDSACDRICSGSSHTSDSKIGILVATLPGALRYRVSAGTGLLSDSIL